MGKARPLALCIVFSFVYCSRLKVLHLAQLIPTLCIPPVHLSLQSPCCFDNFRGERSGLLVVQNMPVSMLRVCRASAFTHILRNPRQPAFFFLQTLCCTQCWFLSSVVFVHWMLTLARFDISFLQHTSWARRSSRRSWPERLLASTSCAPPGSRSGTPTRPGKAPPSLTPSYTCECFVWQTTRRLRIITSATFFSTLSACVCFFKRNRIR